MNKNLRLDRRMTEADLDNYNSGLNVAINDRQKIEAIFDEVADLQAQKNKMYGNSFEESLEEFGLVAGVIQLSHKFNRLKSLVQGMENNAESERDTAIDIIGYAVMLVAFMDKQETNDLLEKESAIQKLGKMRARKALTMDTEKDPSALR